MGQTFGLCYSNSQPVSGSPDAGAKGLLQMDVLFELLAYKRRKQLRFLILNLMVIYILATNLPRDSYPSVVSKLNA